MLVVIDFMLVVIAIIGKELQTLKGHDSHGRSRDMKVTDGELVHLAGLTNLKSLSLPKQITDAGLVHLKGLTSLEELDLSGTQVTDAGLAAMQQTLPNCEISN